MDEKVLLQLLEGIAGGGFAFIEVDPNAIKSLSAVHNLMTFSAALSKMGDMAIAVYDELAGNEELQELTPINLPGLARFVVSTYNMRINIVDRVIDEPGDIPQSLQDEKADIVEGLRKSRDAFRDRSVL